jgi:hypothetical protein
MTPTETGWEGGLGENDSAVLYIYAKDPRSKLWQRSSRVCHVGYKMSSAPFGDRIWWVDFVMPVDGTHQHGPYRTKDEAKAMAVTLWRMT